MMKRTEWNEQITKMKGGLIVSVQAEAGSPLDTPACIAALAQSVAAPGVVGLRINGPENVRAVKAALALPVIGIDKVYEGGRVWITPTFALAKELVEAGAEIIAIDATEHLSKPEGPLHALVQRIHTELNAAVMADISNFEEGIAAEQAGADLVATTLSGYTHLPVASPFDPPDMELVQRLSKALSVPLICEGRLNTPELALQAIKAGAYAVVVGSAITRPQHIVRTFTEVLKGNRVEQGGS